MHVKVRHFLMTVPADVGDDAEPAFGNAGQFGHMRDHAGEGGLLFRRRRGGEIAPVDIGPFRDHQDMNRPCRVDVAEGQRVVILGDLRAGNLATQDPGKDVLVVIGHQLSSF